jgi:hypothetical protein
MKSHEFSSSSGPKKKIDHSPKSLLWSMDVRVTDKAVKRGVLASRGIPRLIINIVRYTRMSGSPT